MIIRAFIYAVFLAFPLHFFSACAGGEAPLANMLPENPQKNPHVNPAAGNNHTALISVKSSQELVYNGKPQPIPFSNRGKEAPGVIYYPTPQARKEGKGGTAAAPVQAGTYYVRLLGYSDGKDHPLVEEHLVEYHILKRPVKIEAAENQGAFYNGDPKRVQAKADPPVLLSFSYYPNRELRDTAQKAAAEAILKWGSSLVPTDSYSGYKRVERAPIEPGTYYVWVYFPGDENHEAAQANVEFTISPPEI